MKKRKRYIRDALSAFFNPASASKLLHDDLKLHRDKILLLKAEYSNLFKWNMEYVNALGLLTEAIDALVWKKDADHRYILANLLHCKTFFNLTELSNCQDVIVGQTDKELIKSVFSNKKDSHTFHRNCIDSDKYVEKMEDTVHFLEAGLVAGKELLLYVIKTPQYSDKGVFLGTLGIGWNVSEQSNFLITQLNRWIYSKKVKRLFHQDSEFCYALEPGFKTCRIFNHVCPSPKRNPESNNS